MEKLRFVCKRGQEVFNESESVGLALSQALTILYDAQVKRCKCRIDEYYKDRNKYCKITGRYTEPDGKFTDYVVSGIRNDWGNFIDVADTLKDNNIKIIQGSNENEE